MTKSTPPTESLSLLRSSPVGVARPAEIAAERERLVPWLEQRVAELPAERAQHRRGQWRRAAVLGPLAVAAAVALALGVTWKASGPASPTSASEGSTYATLLDGHVDSGTLQLLPGSHLGPESKIRTPSGSGANLVTNRGALLSAQPNTQLVLLPEIAGVDGQTARVEVNAGSVGFAVPKLAPGSRFQVLTADAEVTVVGTKFMVTVGVTGTCVRVEEGAVAVRRASESVLLHAGERSGCDAREPSTSAALESPPASKLTPSAALAPEVAPRASTGSPTEPSSRMSSKLPEQNRLLTRALAAERRGDWGGARRAFSALIEKYPDSPFVLEARAGLERSKGH